MPISIAEIVFRFSRSIGYFCAGTQDVLIRNAVIINLRILCHLCGTGVFGMDFNGFRARLEGVSESVCAYKVTCNVFRRRIFYTGKILYVGTKNISEPSGGGMGL